MIRSPSCLRVPRLVLTATYQDARLILDSPTLSHIILERTLGTQKPGIRAGGTWHPGCSNAGRVNSKP